MTREEAKELIYELINSGILADELEEKLTDLADRICQDNFDLCTGTDYCGDCKFKKQ